MGQNPGLPTARIREAAGNRRGYCLALQAYVLQVLEIEHIVQTARGGNDSEENLWLECRMCNVANSRPAARTAIRRSADV
ncbi:MAG TPA: HNH endonuclease signature motif containing protein [Blastocatellia bacterium]|nr:HNH endonuclease signature motif containing protein [Blastocatellia bacterium]